MAENGLKTFSMHSSDDKYERTVATISGELADADRSLPAELAPENQDPETVARRYLNQMIASPAVPSLTAAPAETATYYQTVATEAVPLTGTKVVKFAQYLHHIPVYGSLITIELDDDNSLLSVNSALGEPEKVDPVASVSPARAKEVIAEDGGAFSPPAELPRLYYYFDDRKRRGTWRLVYIAKNVRREAAGNGAASSMPQLFDYVIDAHGKGELIARLPRSQSVTWRPEELETADALGKPRHIRAEHNESGKHRLSDTVRHVQTHNFNFRDIARGDGILPGDIVVNPPKPWDTGAISAHANAEEVVDFLFQELHRNGLDNLGSPVVSSINCTFRNANPANKEWRNAAWIGTQMVYGQRMVNGKLRSYAVAKDVVAHEIIHGLTDHTARLEYRRESGALNESYSDILGIIISNRHLPDIGDWNWELGEDLDGTGVPIRDLSDPTLHGQPAHMDDFRQLNPGEVPSDANDHGFVHVNSGIHNKAAHNLITSKASTGKFLFTPHEVAALFYLALSQRLTRTSGFSASRRGVVLSALTLFRNDPQATRTKKLAAIAKAFDDVGITA
ncbi:M4 family metallopeptidase [Micromonospora sp. CPCC 206061]|uniref:M4 family metallopeptidase n=1 Tax=Micromonospora sp. CPCC 206061 TaxID=3122410 RepID=UPI002FF0714E